MDGGVLKKHPILIINVFIFTILSGVNIFNLISMGNIVSSKALYVIPLLLIPILCIIFRNKYKFNAFLYAAMSIICLMTTSEAGNLTGIVFLLYSLYIFQSFKTNIIILGITVLTIASKMFFGFTSMQVIILFIGYIYCLLIYYILIHPKKPNIYTGLDEITREIIEYKMAGWSTKQVADKVCLSTDAVQKRISRACDKYDAGNLAQLVYKLMKKGYIST